MAKKKKIIPQDTEINSWCEFTEVGLKVKKKPSFDQWKETGSGLGVMRTAIPFAIGDWINFGEGEYGERWSQASDVFGQYDYNTVSNYASVCRKVPIEIRESVLSYSHHQAVAKLERDQQIYWLKKAISDPDEDGRMLTSTELRAKIKGEIEVPLTPAQDLYKQSKQIHTKIEAMIATATGQDMTEAHDLLIRGFSIFADIVTLLEPEEEDEDDTNWTERKDIS
jgi:hypothetical protein